MDIFWREFILEINRRIPNRNPSKKIYQMKFPPKFKAPLLIIVKEKILLFLLRIGKMKKK